VRRAGDGCGSQLARVAEMRYPLGTGMGQNKGRDLRKANPLQAIQRLQIGLQGIQVGRTEASVDTAVAALEYGAAPRGDQKPHNNTPLGPVWMGV
jgi:hypothetical protein